LPTKRRGPNAEYPIDLIGRSDALFIEQEMESIGAVRGGGESMVRSAIK